MTKVQLLIEDVEENTGFYINEYDIVTTPNDFNTMTIFNFLEIGSIKLPIFQRNYTWTKQQASKLIESLLLNLPIPQIFLYEETKNKFLILDGQQRLMSIYFFIKGRFPKQGKRSEIRDRLALEKKLTDDFLSDDNLFQDFYLDLPKNEDGKKQSIFEGRSYNSLADYKTSFDLRTVRLVNIRQNEPKNDNSSIYEIYGRLNTGGTQLNPQEIRVNLYHSEFYNFLYELNKNEDWRTIIGENKTDDFMKDVEILLRAIGLLTWREHYKPSMESFLNRYSIHCKKNYNKDTINLINKIFISFINSIKNLPKKSFRMFSSKKNTKGQKFSISIFESIFVGLCSPMWDSKTVHPLPELCIDQLETFIKMPDFIKTLQEGTTKKANIDKRIQLAQAFFSHNF